jgi:hypothetical protein
MQPANALTNLQRSDLYYDGLEQRLGFSVRDGRAFLVHCAGVSFEGRQDLLGQAKTLCSYEYTPPVKLVPEPTNQYDPNAVQVWIGVAQDNLTGEAKMHQVGYLPKKRCPACAESLSGKRAASQLCPKCDAEIGLGSEWEVFAEINKFVKDYLDAGITLPVGLDNVTESQSGQGNLGCDIWIRIPEPTNSEPTES